jgi:hypothetical protein
MVIPHLFIVKTWILPIYATNLIVGLFTVQVVAMKNRNSEDSLKAWVDKALSDSKTLKVAEVINLKLTAEGIIRKGGLRGNVSDAWKAMGFNAVDIPDLYV